MLQLLTMCAVFTTLHLLVLYPWRLEAWGRKEISSSLAANQAEWMEWLLGRQPSGPCATQNAAWSHQHLYLMKETGGECGPNGGSQKRSAFHPLTNWSGTKCSGGDARGRLV